MLQSLIFLAQTTTTSDDGGGAAILIQLCCQGILWVIITAGLWGIFAKAGQPGWAAIIPLYNYYVILQIIGRPWWWLLLMFIPFVNFVVAIMVYLDLAKAFGKGTGYGCGMILLPFIFIPLLGFDGSRYEGAPN